MTLRPTPLKTHFVPRGRGAVVVGVFSSAWGGLFNIYRLVYFTAYYTRHRPSWLGYNLSTGICLCMWVSVRGLKETSRRQIVTIVALRYTRVNRFHHRRRPSRSIGRSVCAPKKRSTQTDTPVSWRSDCVANWITVRNRTPSRSSFRPSVPSPVHCSPGVSPVVCVAVSPAEPAFTGDDSSYSAALYTGWVRKSPWV